MRDSTKWTLIVLAAVAALIVALLTGRGGDAGEGTANGRPPGPTPTGEATRPPSQRLDDAMLKAPRDAADLEPCLPADGGRTDGGPLAGVRLDCLGAPGSVTLGETLGGRPALVNIWAHWCGPCANELPLLQEFANRAGGRVRVVTVHANDLQTDPLILLSRLGVRLPAIYDPGNEVAKAAGVGPMIPTTLFVRADGTLAGPHFGEFRDVDQMAAEVEEKLGVST